MAETEPTPMQPLPDSGQAADANESNGELPTDYESMTIEEMEAEFAAGHGNIQPEIEDPPPAPEAEPEPVAAEEKSDKEPQAASDDTPPVEDAPAEPLPETDDRELQMQELQLQIERMRLDKQHFEHLAGKNATAVDDLRKELQTSSAPQVPIAEDSIDYSEPQPSVASSPRIVPAPDAGLAGKVAELQQSQVAQETERVYNSFLGKIKSDLSTQGVKPDEIEAETESVMQQITPTLKQGFEPYGDLSGYGTKTLSKVTRMVLDSAYTDMRLAKVATLRKQASERTATQIAETRIAKQAASPSGSGGTPIQEPPPRSIGDLSAEEADAEMIRLSGEGVKPRPY